MKNLIDSNFWKRDYKKENCTAHGGMFTRKPLFAKNPKFSTSSQDYLTYHVINKYSGRKNDFNFILCYEHFLGLFALGQNESTQNYSPVKPYMHPDTKIDRVVDTELEEELLPCLPFVV